jgi:predicted RNase H-like HicB family nuclease
MMIAQYIDAAMELAEFELMENGRYFADIPACEGVWAEGANVEECRAQLPEVLEGWIIVGLRHGDQIPVIAGIDLNPHLVHAEAN